MILKFFGFYGNMLKKGWAKGVMTVEAAVIVPMSVTFTVLLIGYCYYAHQANWCEGAAYEAVLNGLQREKTADEACQAVQERIDSRLSEAPLTAGSITAEAASSGNLTVSWESTVLPELFGERFYFKGEASLLRINAVTIKRTEHILKNLTKEQ